MQLSDRDRELLLQTFLAEAGEHVRAIESGLVAFEANPGDAETLHGVFRSAHSLKGDAAMVGFPRIAEFAHAVEDVLDGLRESELAVTAELITLLLGAVDVLRTMVAGAAAGRDEAPATLDTIRAALDSARSARGSHGSVPQAAPAAPAAATTSVAPDARTLRIDVAKLDRMLTLTGEIAIARGRVAQLLEAMPAQSGGAALEAHREADRLQLELQELVTKARMVPVGPFFRGYARTVRDLARTHGKDVRLETSGDDVEVDTRVVEGLRDPLTHMIRNAIDHAFESPELRAALGKPAQGCLTLHAAHEGGMIVLRVSDDGAGFNRRRIAERARALGLIAADQIDDETLLPLVFAPGFSTAETVTDLSGRGVGMDVVRRNIEALRGTIDIASVEGEGATVTIRLPLTLAIIDGFAVGVADETYVVPLDAVQECLALPADRHEDGAGRGVVNLRGAPLPFVRMRELMGADGEAPARQHVLVVQDGAGRAGVVVDALHGESQAVIKSLGNTFRHLPCVSGSTILGSGRVALILDVPGLLRAARGRTLTPTL